MPSAALHPVVHLELQTDNAARACAFYTRVFGWRAERVVVEAGPYVVLGLGVAIEGGVVEREVEDPRWLPYVAVDDAWEATARARLLGASVLLGPREGPSGWRSVLSSPSGGEIALWQPKQGPTMNRIRNGGTR